MSLVSKVEIEPLNGDNFVIWKKQIEMLLIEQDLELWQHVTGEAPRPQPRDSTNIRPAEQNAIKSWETMDRKAYAAIFLRIGKSHVTFAHGTHTAKELWDVLANLFEAKGPIGIINTRREFFRTFAEEGADMHEHIRKLKSLQETLHSLGEVISESDFKNTLLTSLPDSW